MQESWMANKREFSFKVKECSEAEAECIFDIREHRESEHDGQIERKKVFFKLSACCLRS